LIDTGGKLVNYNDNIDKLTRLLSDTFMGEGLTREIKRAERYKRPLTFLLIDPGIPEDKFHMVGYLALKKLAGIVRNLTRYLDIKIRLKNRILVLLPETEREGGLRVAIKIKAMLDKVRFLEFPEIIPEGNVAIASFPEDGVDKNSIMLSLEQDLGIPLMEKLPAGFEKQVNLDEVAHAEQNEMDDDEVYS
jgi:diguanylate cyclase (GGDEF)-like protein